jgi:hypothetical protein
MVFALLRMFERMFECVLSKKIPERAGTNPVTLGESREQQLPGNNHEVAGKP